MGTRLFRSRHVIPEPGSYYLAGNLDVTTPSGIVIAASGMTLDLMGFNIFRSSAAAATGTAINFTVGGLSNIAIKNGHITSDDSHPIRVKNLWNRQIFRFARVVTNR